MVSSIDELMRRDNPLSGRWFQYGLGLDVQAEQCQRYFDYLKTLPAYADVTWGGLFRDEVQSAYKQFAHRPEGKRLLAALEPGDHIVLAKLDRGFRSMIGMSKQLEDWDSKGIRVHIVDLQIDTGTPNGRLLLNIVGTVAQWNSQLKSERIREIKARAKLFGHYVGGHVPLGFKVSRRWGKYLYRYPAARAFMQHVVRLRDDQKMTWPAITLEIERLVAKSEKRKAATVESQCQWKHSRLKRCYTAEKRLQAEALRGPALAC